MQATATRPQPTGTTPAVTRPSTWWLVVTHSGTHMLTLCPDSSYAPVNVWENGYLVPIKARTRCAPAERPEVRREVVPDFSAAADSSRVPVSHAVWELRLHRNTTGR